MSRTTLGIITILVSFATTAGSAQDTFDFANHHLHNFYISERTYERALAMGYRLVPSSNNIDRKGNPEYRRIGAIRNHNSHICPLRVHARKSDGKLFATYHSFAGTTSEGLNPVALANGIHRKNSYGPRVEMDADDLQMLKGYGAARLDVTDLTMSNVTYEEIRKRVGVHGFKP